MKIDPDNITNYDLDRRGLEEHLIFWILAAGKTARHMAKVHAQLIDMLMARCPAMWPSSCIYMLDEESLSKFLKSVGCGCFNNKAKSLKSFAERSIYLNLYECEPSDLIKIYGVGPKTARCFILHSRKGARYAGLDTHILKWFRNVLLLDAPMRTPRGERQYRELEIIFLEECDRRGVEPAVLDLEIWKSYRK